MADKYKGKFDAAGTTCVKKPSRGRRTRRHTCGRRSHRAPGKIPPGTTSRRLQARAGSPDGSLRGLHGVHRPSRRPAPRCVKQLGVLDDTLIYYIIGDNGASAEGTHQGTFNEMSYFNGLQALETPEFLGVPRQAGRSRLLQPLRRRLGACDGHALPMDQAGRLALGRHAQRTIVALAQGHQGQVRPALSSTHVIDVAPTILEAAGVPEPMR